MRLGFDGRVFRHAAVTGVERYARELYNHLGMLTKLELFLPQATSRYGQHLWVQTGLPYAARRAKLDVLFCPVMAAPLWLDRRIKLVVTVQDLMCFRFPEMYSWAFRNYYRVLIPLVIRRADRILTLTQAERENIISLYPFADEKVEAIHLGVADRFVWEKCAREQVILAVGSTNKHKNLSGLLRAFALIADQIPHQLVIVGGGRSIISSDDSIDEILRFLPAGRVTLTGYVSDDELAGWYNRADFFVFPSFFEGFGLPPIEAMACGCPVIVSNCSCLPEVCGDSASYCNPDDPADIARAMLTLARDPDEKDRLREKGLRHAMKFGWRRCAELTLEAIRGTV